MKFITKFVAGLFGGLIMAIIGTVLITLLFAASPETGGTIGSVAFLLLWILGFVIAFTASRAARAWRRLLITTGIFTLLTPISGIIFSGTVTSKMVSDLNGSELESAGAILGTTIGGGLITGFLGFVGFFLGAVFLIIGLLVGREAK